MYYFAGQFPSPVLVVRCCDVGVGCIRCANRSACVSTAIRVLVCPVMSVFRGVCGWVNPLFSIFLFLQCGFGGVYCCVAVRVCIDLVYFNCNCCFVVRLV